MSRGLGSMQQWIDQRLSHEGLTVAEMLRSYLEEGEREIKEMTFVCSVCV
jgi:hypothetical protein